MKKVDKSTSDGTIDDSSTNVQGSQVCQPIAKHNVSGCADLMIKHCEKCNELTPQVDNNTTGMCCHVCLHSNPYTFEHVAFKATSEWFAAFWQKKYYEVAGFNGGNSFVITFGEHSH